FISLTADSYLHCFCMCSAVEGHLLAPQKVGGRHINMNKPRNTFDIPKFLPLTTLTIV
ncbi:Hypothetical predicted protein, partial [Paramuricea clavata]